MRESSSVHDKMIDRNWVLKRKRKRVLCGADLSNGKETVSLALDSPISKPSVKKKLKSDISISRSARKIKGHDGYYFECVECDLGGNLLCCDSCPRTYHLECLKPPLKRTPPGKWQCPSCCEQKEYVKLLSNADANTRRARTKSKSKSKRKLSGSDKTSVTGRSPIPGKVKLKSKGKATSPRRDPSVEKKPDSCQIGTSCNTKSSPSCDAGSRDGIASPVDNKSEKKPSSPCDLKTNFPHNKEIHSPVKTLDLGSSDKSPEAKSDLCKNEIQGKKLIPPFCRPTQSSRKKRQKLNKGDKKVSRTEKGKRVVKIVCKHTSKETSPSPENSGSFQKCKSTGQRISASTTKEEIRKVASHKQPERFAEGASPTPHGFDGQGADVDRTMKCHENLLDGVQQVDRILGCRVHSSKVMSSSQAQPIEGDTSPTHTKSGSNSGGLATVLPSRGSIIPEDSGKLLEEYHVGGRVVDKRDVGNVLGEGCSNDANQVDGKQDVEDLNTVDEDLCGRIHRTKEFTEESKVMTPAKESSKDQGLGAKNYEFLEADTDVELVSACNHGNSHMPKPKLSQVSATCDSEGINDASMERQPDNIVENRVPKITVQEPEIKDKDTVYEFLVKWVGQSHIHNSWVSESQLKVLAKRKLENYKGKYGTAVINVSQEDWSKPQRVIALRVSQDGTEEALVKWFGLQYDECTWERLDEPLIEKSGHLIAEFKLFESQTLDKDARDDHPRTKGDYPEVVPLKEQPKELQGGSLFPHQLEALNWLRKCWHKSKNVILADEMGLGKTISACAFISSLFVEFKAKLPCLVLVPLSTMPNWLAEFSLWAPHLNVVEYHGCAKARSIIRQYEWHASDPDGLRRIATSYKFNVLLTTYEMVLADSSHLRGVPWEVLVVDEGHRLKNSSSKLFSLLNSFSFQHRVLLTGTPLQNNIGEMYNLLNFLQPASFPSLSAFEEKFNDLTTAEKVEELKKLVSPHMLRRLKKDAMQNIPPKTERMVPVELSSIQAEYYRAMLTKNYQILRNVGKGGAQQSMLNIVMQLRKVCNHPYLIPGTEPESGSIEFLQEMRIKASAKLALLHSMLKFLSKEGHRVLIFSQMTKLLDILEDYLTIEFGPKTFERVDGSVSVADRQTAIARFNQDKTKFVFLLSTRSCGLGINLATADTVIIYDSDFNPHADIQAMNRAHRIGQSKRLLVYRLVVRASVEERILQLAKKKLMLDQLFVNKSESQKEVEDILRWGTEELFGDCDGVSGKDSKETSNNKVESVVDPEHKHRRRAGGLGDVYQDRLTDDCTKIVWDENAILKLLDRSNLQSTVSESIDGDLENDVLGSVKSLEWNDELNEEPGGTELLPGIAGDGCEQTSEAKEDNAISGTEENEWDRLLRVRWEKYQTEEEAALGRGKRLRKAVSYRETFAPIPSEALSESGDDEEEPEPVYTPAGRLLKEKFAKLRARQKERLARRHIAEVPCSTGSQLGSELLVQSLFPSAKEGESLDTNKPLEVIMEQASSIKLEDAKSAQSSEAKNRNDSIARVGFFPKHGYKRFHSTHLDLSVKPVTLSTDIFLPSHQLQSTSFANSVPASNNLPVLGLCAPNAYLADSAPRNFRSFLRQPMSNHEQRRTSAGISEFSFPLAGGAGPSNNLNINSRETTADTSLLPDTSVEALHRRLKNIIPDSYFPYNPCLPPNALKGKGPPDPLDSSGASFSAFQEKLVLPNLGLDDTPLPKFSHPSKNAMKPHLDFLPNLSLGMKLEDLNGPIQDLPNIPQAPNFRQQLSGNLKQKQQVAELPPMLGLGSMQATHSSLPENHRKVLDNIMMRTGSGSSKFLKKRLKVDAWSEDELDALWIGVRRHGRGNWDAMLRDSKLKFSKYRTSEDLCTRWGEEQLKILDGPAFAAAKSSKSTSFLGISDGMMSRALLGSRFTGFGTDPPKFRSHLTDIQLGCGDLTPGLPRIDPTNHFGSVNESFSPFPPWPLDKLGSNFPGDFGVGPSDRPGNLNLPSDQPFQHNPSPASNFGSVSINCSTSGDLQRNEDEQWANKYLKLPSLLDRSLNMLRDFQNNIHSGEPNTGLPLDPNKKQIPRNSPTNEDTSVRSSKLNKLPHWLREAVSVPPTRPPEPDLPPTVSAIAQSVRLLYGEEKPTIPPFTIPGPPPFQPKDPRKSLKQKRKSHKHRQVTPEFISSIKNIDCTASSTIPPAPPSMSCSSGLPWTDPNFKLPSLNLNLNPPSSSSFVIHGKKEGMTLSPSPEVLHLVASCVAPDMPSSSCQRSELPASKDFESFELAGKDVTGDLKGVRGKRKASRNSVLGCWGKLTEEQIDRAESGDSSKTQSDPCQADQLEIEEISSEETVSDNHRSEHES